MIEVEYCKMGETRHRMYFPKMSVSWDKSRGIISDYQDKSRAMTFISDPGHEYLHVSLI